VVLTDPFIAF